MCAKDTMTLSSIGKETKQCRNETNTFERSDKNENVVQAEIYRAEEGIWSYIEREKRKNEYIRNRTT